MTLAWHFLPENKRLRYGDDRVVRSGCTYRYRGEEPIDLCLRGMHASVNIMDALSYAPSPVICRVELSGDVIHGGDKVVASARKVLWMYDASMVLHEFACRVASSALRNAGVTDRRCWNAIRTKRKWMRGQIGDDRLLAAHAAAWAASRASAWMSPSGSAASAAAHAVSRDASHAASNAASNAAALAAWVTQSKQLERMIIKNRPEVE